MTDIRRTLLWGIFLASLFFIWESWNRHNGQPSMFGELAGLVEHPHERVAPSDRHARGHRRPPLPGAR